MLQRTLQHLNVTSLKWTYISTWMMW
jgi:hypothetical protein